LHGEDWSVIPLLSPNSDSNRTDPSLPEEDYGLTPLLSKLDAFESLLDSIPCEKSHLVKLHIEANLA
jgi:hypothetical protein